MTSSRAVRGNDREGSRQGQSRPGFQGGSSWRNHNTGGERVVNDNRGGGRNESREVSTVFNRDVEEILEEEEPKIKTVAVLPTVEATFGGVRVCCLVDSGSQVTGVSENFLKQLVRVDESIPRMPCKCVVLSGAIGNKSTVGREQVYLTFELGGREFEYCFLVIPGLVRNIILGCDWLRDNSLIINFSENALQGEFGGKIFSHMFNYEPNPGVHISISEVIEEETYLGYSSASQLSESKMLQYYSEADIHASAQAAEGFDEEYKERLENLLLKYIIVSIVPQDLWRGPKRKLRQHFAKTETERRKSRQRPPSTVSAPTLAAVVANKQPQNQEEQAAQPAAAAKSAAEGENGVHLRTGGEGGGFGVIKSIPPPAISHHYMRAIYSEADSSDTESPDDVIWRDGDLDNTR
nr:unnamed protein product [Callosobruchus analis]